MASGDTLLIFTPHANEPPVTNFATIDLRNAHLVLDFDASTAESAVFGGILPRHYVGGGLTVTIVWMATTATSGDVKWNAQIERHQDMTGDLDTDSFAAAETTLDSTPSISGQPQYSSIPFTSGAQMDSLAKGESFRLKITRDAADAADTVVGDAELLRVEIRET